jgi:hypothetical protein
VKILEVQKPGATGHLGAITFFSTKSLASDLVGGRDKLSWTKAIHSGREGLKREREGGRGERRKPKQENLTEICPHR